ncbi:MAG: hypothetical protein EOL87_12310 [Spartobacteria bacterium]|nr:hypothetical protein [Spartobacteria bacterium]
MKRQYTTKQDGSVLMLVVILTSIACLSFTSIYRNIINFTTLNRKTRQSDRAFLLADAALSAAIADLRSGGDGVITRDESRNFFASPLSTSSDWGFETSVSGTGDTKTITGTGWDKGSSSSVQADAARTFSIQTIHSLYAFAIYSGNSSGDTNYVLEVGGTGTSADFVNGDVYSGNDVEVTGDAILRYPELHTDANGDGAWNNGEEWLEFGATYFSNALSQAEYDAYAAARDSEMKYGDGVYNPGEAFVDTMGNGIYDAGESYTDVDGDGVYSFGDTFVDTNGDGLYDAGEEFTDRGNGVYDEGENFTDINGNGVRDEGSGHWEVFLMWRRYVVDSVTEEFEDLGNGSYDSGEDFVDLDGVYTEGETFYDDRNGKYDYGTVASGDITGMPSPMTDYPALTGGDEAISPPDLTGMHYETSKTSTAPAGALDGWGNDIDVASGSFNSSGIITDSNDPRHIFRKNATDRSYSKIPGKDDYFLEDYTDSSYNNSHQYIDVKDNGNNKVYYIDGNLYIHNAHTYDFMFRNPGIKITIVAKGNITISDEFWYNGGTSDPEDMLVLIAMKDPSQSDSGNIYLGDEQFGTGGDIHAMLYAENDFVDNNLDTTGQPYLSVFGNMSAGNQVRINRTAGHQRTRLDVTLDERINSGAMLPPGLPGAASGQRNIATAEEWGLVAGTWHGFSRLQ